LSSIDRSSVDFEGGEMSFGLFDYEESKVAPLFERRGRDDRQVLEEMRRYFSESEFPSYVYNYLLQELSPKSKLVSFHKPSGFGTAASKYTPEERQNIRRT